MNAFTGPPVPPTFSTLLRRALGAGVREAVELSNDPRFLRGIVPSANVVSTAEELSAFYQCLLDGGELDGVRVFDPRTVHHATAEQSYREIDLTLGLPIRYGIGFMLGDDPVGLFGPGPPAPSATSASPTSRAGPTPSALWRWRCSPAASRS